MGDVAEISTLTLDQVTQLISQDKSARANPLLAGVQVFNNLGDNVLLPDPTLALTLIASGVPVDPSLAPLLGGVQKILKAGIHVSMTPNQYTELSLKNIRLRFAKYANFDVSDDAGSPALNNIIGLAGHELFWVDVHRIQLTQNQGRWCVAVKTPLKNNRF